MLAYSDLREEYDEDRDSIPLWNMQQNAFYYNELIKSGNLNEQLIDIFVKVEIDPMTKKEKERMAFVWKKSDATRNLKAIWDARPH